MELIPVFSLIVLVATIGTFILAVGAYVLFKVRERRGEVADDMRDAAFEAEVIAPNPYLVEEAGALPVDPAPHRRESPADPPRVRYGPDAPLPAQKRRADDRERWQ